MRKFSSPQKLGIQQFLIYKIRFILAGVCCRAFEKFGGICSQINNSGALLNIATADNPLVAMRYDSALGRRLAEYARGRTPDVDFEALLSNEQYELKRSILADIARPTWLVDSTATRTDSDTQVKGKGEKGGKTHPRAKKLPRPPQQD